MNVGLNCTVRACITRRGVTQCAARYAIHSLSKKLPPLTLPDLSRTVASQSPTGRSLVASPYHHVCSPLSPGHSRLGSITFKMSGKSWFSLSSWYGSGGQEGASSEATEAKELKNGDAGAAGAAAAEPKRHDHHGHHGHHKKHKKRDEDDGEIKYPAVDTYGPITIKGSDLIPGKRMKWCTCGLSKEAPWCDGAHKKTGFKSLKWVVPENPDAVYQFCNCQYTKTPPFCDGTHTNLPEEVEARQKNCPKRDHHEECLKLCTGCGFKVDF